MRNEMFAGTDGSVSYLKVAQKNGFKVGIRPLPDYSMNGSTALNVRVRVARLDAEELGETKSVHGRRSKKIEEIGGDFVKEFPRAPFHSLNETRGSFILSLGFVPKRPRKDQYDLLFYVLKNLMKLRTNKEQINKFLTSAVKSTPSY